MLGMGKGGDVRLSRNPSLGILIFRQRMMIMQTGPRMRMSPNTVSGTRQTFRVSCFSAKSRPMKWVLVLFPFYGGGNWDLDKINEEPQKME